MKSTLLYQTFLKGKYCFILDKLDRAKEYQAYIIEYIQLTSFNYISLVDENSQYHKHASIDSKCSVVWKNYELGVCS